MKELYILIESLLESTNESQNKNYIKNNYLSLRKLKDYITIEKIVPRLTELSKFK